MGRRHRRRLAVFITSCWRGRRLSVTLPLVKGRQQGFTVAEIVVALGLISLVALAVIGVFSRLMGSTSKSADQAAADLLAQAVLDRAARTGPPEWGGLQSGVTLRTADSSSDTEFLYRVDTRLLPGSDHPLGSLYSVTVLVSWSGSLDKQDELGRGKLWLERSRLTYVEADLAP